MNKRLEQSSAEMLNSVKQDVEYNENRVRSLQAFLPKEATRDQLKTKEIPALEKQLAEQESLLEQASREAEQVRNRSIYILNEEPDNTL